MSVRRDRVDADVARRRVRAEDEQVEAVVDLLEQVARPGQQAEPERRAQAGVRPLGALVRPAQQERADHRRDPARRRQPRDGAGQLERDRQAGGHDQQHARGRELEAHVALVAVAAEQDRDRELGGHQRRDGRQRDDRQREIDRVEDRVTREQVEAQAGGRADQAEPGRHAIALHERPPGRPAAADLVGEAARQSQRADQHGEADERDQQRERAVARRADHPREHDAQHAGRDQRPDVRDHRQGGAGGEVARLRVCGWRPGILHAG